MFRFTTAIAAACALTFSATSAIAASSSSVAITSLNFTLIDLTPQDGIGPSFSFSNSSGATILTVAADEGLGNDGQSRTRVGTFAFDHEFMADLAHASAQAKIDGYALSAKGAASGPQTRYSASASTGNNVGYYNSPLNLTVSANTVLLIDAHVSMAASATNPSTCPFSYSCSWESAYAAASLSLSYTDNTDYLNTPHITKASTSLYATARGAYTERYYDFSHVNPATGWYDYVETITPELEETKSLNEVLSAVLTNASAQNQSAIFGMTVSVSGQATSPEGVSAVPEPETCVLAVAGLGIVGLMANRRRRHG